MNGIERAQGRAIQVGSIGVGVPIQTGVDPPPNNAHGGVEAGGQLVSNWAIKVIAELEVVAVDALWFRPRAGVAIVAPDTLITSCGGLQRLKSKGDAVLVVVLCVWLRLKVGRCGGRPQGQAAIASNSDIQLNMCTVALDSDWLGLIHRHLNVGGGIVAWACRYTENISVGHGLIAIWTSFAWGRDEFLDMRGELPPSAELRIALGGCLRIAGLHDVDQRRRQNEGACLATIGPLGSNGGSGALVLANQQATGNGRGADSLTM